MSRTFRSITLAAALLVLCSSATYARPSAGWLAPENLLAAMWERVVAWFAPAGSIWEKEGSQMDPNGQPVVSNIGEGIPGEEGSSMDPNGNK